MRTIILGSLLAVGLLAALPAPASAQSIGIGPRGVEIDPRTPGQRHRDFERREMRRDMMREDRREMRREMRRREMRRDMYRRGY